MVQVIPVILTFHTYGTGISAGIISDLYRDHICSVGLLVWFVQNPYFDVIFPLKKNFVFER